MTPPTLRSRFTLEPLVFVYLEGLHNSYVEKLDTRAVLQSLQAELGAEEYANFETDLRKLMLRMSAASAVVMIARQAKDRTVHARPSGQKQRRRLYDFAAQFE